MPNSKHPPLTAEEIELAKLYSRWYGGRKAYLTATDKPRGNEFSTKNLENLTDQFLLTAPAMTLSPAELASLVRRYRAIKMAATKAKKKRAQQRARKREIVAAEKAARQAAREAKRQQAQELAARQGSLAL